MIVIAEVPEYIHQAEKLLSASEGQNDWIHGLRGEKWENLLTVFRAV